MRLSIWLIVLLWGVGVAGCGSARAEISVRQKDFWVGYWKIHPKSVEKAQSSTVGMALWEDGTYQDGSYNRRKFYPLSSKKGLWDISGEYLLLIQGKVTNQGQFSLQTNGGIELEIHGSRIFLARETNIIQQ